MVFSLIVAAALSAAEPHVVGIDAAVPSADEGLLLGNGGFCCSAFQTADEIVFRFGRNDVWDRRVDLSRNPKPPTHAEFVRGILDEGWTCRSWTSLDAKATKGTKDEKRFLEICQGVPPSIKDFPYPCPKPLGELHLKIPVDLPGFPAWRQRLIIEEGRLEIEARWTCGVAITVEAAIAPDDDVFAVRWSAAGWTDTLAPGQGEHRRPPVWCALRRTPDTTGLPPPRSFQVDARRAAVEQPFPAEATFPQGFTARMTFAAPSAALGEVKCFTGEDGAAEVRWLPKQWDRTTGAAFVTARTSSDRTLDAPAPSAYDAVAAAAKASAQAYWAKSALAVPGDRILENLWYATYHARRCVLGGRTVPPGLFIASTLTDRPNWHGDWHSNFNFQSVFWGGLTAGRPEEMRTYFAGARHFYETGRLIASRYYGMRGSCAPLQGFPLKATDDYGGAVPLGRMVYPTGWLMTLYREYYRYTLDREWLAREGYPVLRDVALFYLDFLRKAPSKDLPPELKDGKYHAFPSIEEETRITGPQDVLDRPQVLAHVRHALWAAIEAADELGVDKDLRVQWRDRLDNLVGNVPAKDAYAEYCRNANPPEFGFTGEPYAPPAGWTGVPRVATMKQSFGHSIRHRIMALRKNRFIPGRDYPEYREMLGLRMRPNGLVRAMVASNWGRGGWTESLSCMAPLQEMMLQSWDGAIRLFPYWPKDRDASFAGWRAQGAFVVDAEWKDGKIGRVRIVSEKGADCPIHGDWSVRDASGAAVPLFKDAFGRTCFKTVPGGEYFCR